jgi:hypothetical protein
MGSWSTTSRGLDPGDAFEITFEEYSANPKRHEYFESAIRLRPSYAAYIFQLGRSKYFEGDFKLSICCSRNACGRPYYCRQCLSSGMNWLADLRMPHCFRNVARL